MTKKENAWFSEFYGLYKDGRKNGAPTNYIDYFKTREFILFLVRKEKDKSFKEGYLKCIQDLIDTEFEVDKFGKIEKDNIEELKIDAVKQTMEAAKNFFYSKLLKKYYSK